MESAQDSHQGPKRSQRLPSSHTTFEKQASPRRHGPTSAVGFSSEQPYGGSPREELSDLRNKRLSITPDTKIKRRISRFGLTGLFGRSKVLENECKREMLSAQLEEVEAQEESTGQGHRSPLHARRFSISEEIDALPVESPATQLRQGTSKSNLKAKSSFKKDGTVKTWDPPPLFQAYPQSVKHATLRAPSLSAESIIRLHTSRNHGIKPQSDLYSTEAYSTKEPKENWLRRSNAGDSLSKGDWTHKIFVLVTSGYLLQYSGDGCFDRLPEKIMPLTKESAAFASDVIPGEPYVLQISQVSDDQGTLDKEASRSMLKKLGLRSEIRRSTSTFLLVLESPEESSAWLVAVRKEIQAMGGKQYRPDEFHNRGEEPILQLHEKPSQRFLVRRDPTRFSEKTSEPLSERDLRNGERQWNETPNDVIEPSTPAAMKRQSLATQKSIGSRSVSTATASINQVYLDRLKESPRDSYASTAGKTTSTSRGSSPRPSFDKTVSKVPDLSREFADSRPSPSINTGPMRSSMHKKPTTNAINRMSMPPQQSALYTPQRRRTSSPTAPNFSVPTFSKRYSTSPALSSTPSKTQTPPITLHHEASLSPVVHDQRTTSEKRISTISELQHLRKPNDNVNGRINSSENDTSLKSPHPSSSVDPPTSSEGEKRFSRRFSSLEYSRGVSPIRLARQSPSPHPPPTTALPALPRTASPYRASLIPPPTTSLPPIPSASKLPARYSMLPSPTTSAAISGECEQSSYLADPSPPVKSTTPSPIAEHAFSMPPAAVLESAFRNGPAEGPTTRPSLTHRPAQGGANEQAMATRRSQLPVHIEARSDTVVDQPHPRLPQTGLKTAFEVESLTPPLDGSPPKPTREPPPPPSQQAHSQKRKSTLRIGREPPAVYSPRLSPRPKISVSSKADNYFDAAAPHPFIPPIRVSERKFRGSLDGPWNAPQRTFLDLSV